jgi:hypothetical protein
VLILVLKDVRVLLFSFFLLPDSLDSGFDAFLNTAAWN